MNECQKEKTTEKVENERKRKKIKQSNNCETLTNSAELKNKKTVTLKNV